MLIFQDAERLRLSLSNQLQIPDQNGALTNMEEQIRHILKALGEDPDREGLKDTLPGNSGPRFLDPGLSTGSGKGY
jgi:hypothetical protein